MNEKSHSASKMIRIEDAEGTAKNWSVSHIDEESGLVYVKHQYGEHDTDTFIYRGMSKRRFQELGGAVINSTTCEQSQAASEATPQVHRVSKEAHIPETPHIADHTESDKQADIPATFAEIYDMKGNSIEDFLAKLPDVGNGEASRALAPNYYGKNRKDQQFWNNPAAIEIYDQEMIKLTGELKRQNPFEKELSAVENKGGWRRQYNSRAYIQDRLDKDKGQAEESSVSMYLNAPLESVPMIFRQVVEKADANGIRFYAKVFDPDLSGKSSRASMSRQERAKQWAASPSYRKDHITFYGFSDTTEQLYTIIKEVYEANASVFEDRTSMNGPYKVAPGFSVGEGTAKSKGGSIHSKLLIKAMDGIDKIMLGCKHLSPDERKREFAESFRKVVVQEAGRGQLINPDNLAFR